MTNVFLLNGAPTAGKDTFCEMVIKHGKSHRLTVKTISSVDDVKRLATEMGWSGAKEDKDRDFLAELKYLWKRYNNGPLRDMLAKCKKLDYDILFVHIRETDEIDELKNLLNAAIHEVSLDRIYCWSMYLDRNVTSVTSNAADAQAMTSEGYDYDIILDNNGTLEDLEHAAIAFLQSGENLASQ
jgi:hypothetical protein